MMDGLWTMVFRTNLGMGGSGVVVLNGSRALGGDTSFFYQGEMKNNGGQLEGRINIVRFSQALTSVFGNLENFWVSLSGKMVGDSQFEASGTLDSNPNMKLTVIGYKRVAT